jgi:hypothetical protein
MMEPVPVVVELRGCIANLIRHFLLLQAVEVEAEFPESPMQMPLRRMNQRVLVGVDPIAVQLLQTAERWEAVA